MAHPLDATRSFARMLGRQIVRLALYLWLVHALLFAALLALPDAAERQLGWMAVDRHLLDEAKQRMGLSGGPLHQYITHVKQLCRGDMGCSTQGGYSVAGILGRRIAVSSPVWIGALALLTVLPLPLASLYTRHATPSFLRIVRSAASGGLIPQFVTAVAMFAVYSLIRSSLTVPIAEYVRIGMASIAVAIAPGAISFIAASRLFEECANADYTRTYRAIGMGWWPIRRKLMRNVLIAMRAQLARMVLVAVTSTALTEYVFDIPGYGRLLVEAVQSSDLPLMFGWVLVSAGFVVVASLVELPSADNQQEQ